MEERMKLALPDVTLCAVTSINHELTVRALEKCLAHCTFADAVLISSQPVAAPCRVEVVPPFGGERYAPFVCRNLARTTASPFNLLVQYDGYILDPSAWSDQFLAYDYIGAPWPWHRAGRRVGNSGFCLRSKRLLDILADMPLPPAGTFVDDTFICHTMRDYLEKTCGIGIAPENLAGRFAYERQEPGGATFGFHGLFNFWRHADDAEMERMVDLLDEYYVTTRAFAEVLFRYHDTGKRDAAKKRVFHRWYARLHARMDEPQIRDHLLQYLKDPSFIDTLISGARGAKAA